MTTRRSTLDPLLTAKNVEVEPEQLIEPEDKTPAEVRPGRLRAVRAYLSHYGNRALGSAQHFFVTFREAIVHIGTALAGSVVVLPLIILARGPYVLLRTVFTSARDIVLSLVHAVFDVLRLPFQVLYSLFSTFNKKVLFPALKRIKEDDTFAVIAFVVLVGVALIVYVVAKQIIF